MRTVSFAHGQIAASPDASKPIAAWNACDPRLPGPVIASTRRHPFALISPKNVS
ncbi:MAG TPA: hypothetical protein VI121_03575 [Agromyces sp.]|jgi:hypothetical protein